MPDSSTRHIPAYRFSPLIVEQLRPLFRLDNWHGAAAWLEDVVWVTMAILVSRMTRTTELFWPVYLLVTLPLIAARQRAAGTLLHESVHGTLARSTRLNRLLGTYGSGYLILQSFNAYRTSHVRDHHGHFGDPDRDPDLRGHLEAGLYEPQTAAQFTTRHLLRPLICCQLNLSRRLVVDRLLYRNGNRRELLRIATYISALTAVGVCQMGAAAVILYWYGPLFLAFPVLNWFIELLEHFPYPANANVDIYASRHRAVGPISRYFVGIHNEGFHLDHHLTPRIPFWHLPRAQVIRMQDPAYARVIADAYAAAPWGLLSQVVALVRNRVPWRPAEDGSPTSSTERTLES